MAKVKERVPEGGAIEDEDEMSCEEYSKTMRKKLGKEYRRFVKTLLDKVGIPQHAHVLEVGPGPGWIGIWLLKKRPDLTLDGLEPSGDMRRVALANAASEGVATRAKYHAGAVEDLSQFSGGTYDVVFSNESMHHWVDPAKGLQEIARVLKPAGKVYLADGRRDLGLGAKFIVNVLGPLFAGKMVKWWKSSLAASYTPDEMRELVKCVPRNDWVVKSHFLGLWIESAT